MDKKIVNISSFGRIGSLEKTLESIYNQCDEINLCLNDKITELPDFLLQPKINLYITDNSKGDAFKFMFLETKNGYYLTIDDDLIYPPNYVNFMVDKCKEYNNKKIITLHGRSFYNFPIKSYYNSKAQRFYYNEKVLDDVKVQFGGTGVMCLHTSLLKKSINDFLLPNMADVWIGKFAKENNIDIICVKHEKSFIKSIPQLKTIYDDSKNNDLNQTKIVNKIYDLNTISIIIPTYNNIEYLDESLNSIINSGKNHNIEILVGIDGCQKTLDYVKQKTYPEFVKFHYFNSNNGPYDIKNTLTKISNSEKIIFFDSDDIMTDTTIDEVVVNLGRYDLVRLKYKEIRDNKTSDKTNFHEGAIGINKNIFLSMNGFEPWMCAADSDFLGRLYKKKPRIYHTKNLSMYYRRHNTSLTLKKETGMASPLRATYAKTSKNKKGDGNPDKLHTRDFVLVDVNTLVVDVKNHEYYNNRKTILDKVLNPAPRKVVNQPIKKKDPVINDRTDLLYTNPKPLVRTIKPNKPDNRQELINLKNNTNKSVNKQLFSTKPERRTGINHITIGGKSKM
jgi:glycosyltransferase involved in cell wall biosynthesis